MTKKPILFLAEPDEMRAPYEAALKSVGDEIVWFPTREALLAGSRGTPCSVVVDLDREPAWGETELGELRAAFPEGDLIALSSNDSAQAALACLRAGFADFLVKPLSPEELAWGVRKARQRNELLQRIDDPKAGMVRAATRISAGTSPAMVRLSTLESLRILLGAAGVAWLVPRGGEPHRAVACSVPREDHPEKILWRLPSHASSSGAGVYRAKNGVRRKVLIPCSEPAQGALFAWGIEGVVKKATLSQARMLVQHSELSLLNLVSLEQVKQQTFLDDLTGLYNSRYLKFALTAAVARCRKPGDAFSVLFIDVDHFKAVNDRHGHLVGSEFLVTIGKTIKNAVRGNDAVFRYGGDEFVVLLGGTPLARAREVAERIRRSIAQRVFSIGGATLQTTVSIGLAAYPDTASDLETLLKLADDALYTAKKRSRNAVALAHP